MNFNVIEQERFLEACRYSNARPCSQCVLLIKYKCLSCTYVQKLSAKWGSGCTEARPLSMSRSVGGRS